jgi:DNA-binding IscR family transcriptional regulator
MCLKDIPVMVIDVNGTTGGIMLGKDVNAFRLGDVLPTVGNPPGHIPEIVRGLPP